MTVWCFNAEPFSVVQCWCNFFHVYLQELLEVGRGNLAVWQQPLATHGVTASTPGSYYSIMTCQQDRWELNNEENLNKATPAVLCQTDCVLQPLWLCYICWESDPLLPVAYLEWGAVSVLCFSGMASPPVPSCVRPGLSESQDLALAFWHRDTSTKIQVPWAFSTFHIVEM